MAFGPIIGSIPVRGLRRARDRADAVSGDWRRALDAARNAHLCATASIARGRAARRPPAHPDLAAACGDRRDDVARVDAIEPPAFIPAWYESLGYTAAFYGPLATTIVLASAAGTNGTGSLADRYGRRAIILISLVLTIPALLLFAEFTGPIAFVTVALVGLTAASTGPLMLVMA